MITGIILVYKKNGGYKEARDISESRRLPLGLETQVGVVQSDHKVQRK